MKNRNIHNQTIWVPINKLIVNKNYQRNIDNRLVNNITKNYDSSMIGTITVTTDEELWEELSYEIIDGQNRVKAIKNVLGSNATIQVNCIYNLNEEEKAKYFYELNKNRKSLSSMDLFKAKLVSGDKDSLNLHEICKQYECNILTIDTNSKNNINTCRSIALLQNLYKRNLLEDVLLVIQSAYNHNNNENLAKGKFESRFLQNIATIINVYSKEINFERLVNVLSKNSVNNFNMEYNRQYSPDEIKNFSGCVLIVNAYNKNLRKGRLDVRKLMLGSLNNED
tara:strand:+ start:79 stop:921 length:843 start_codon:yes stop_codon:yes gene_type:complete